MFDWVHNNKRLMQVILAIIFLPFAFFGLESYLTSDGLGAEVARVGDYRVTQQEFQRALQERQEEMRRMVNNAPLDPALLDSPEMRFAALEQIVRERLLLTQAFRMGIKVTDEQLRDLITSQQSFMQDGKFSKDLYEAFLRNQGLSAVAFEANLRRDLLKQPLVDAFGATAMIPRTVVERIIRLSEQTREVSVVNIDPAKYAAQVNVDDAAVKKFYDARTSEFEVPEQVRLDYVVLSLDNVAAQMEIKPDDVRRAYEESPARFSSPEERSASHILIAVPADANGEARAAAKAKAGELAKQAQSNPERFAALAKEHSEDPGSASSGGDLGFLPRGATRKEFDDALFSMKPGEIRGPVETEFGYHIIRLGEVRGGATKPFEEVRAGIEADLKRGIAQKRFAEMAEQLSNMAYEQSDSLAPAAEKLNLKVQQSPWITRTPVPGSPLGSEKFLRAAFSEDVLKNNRNSEVVEVAPGTLMVARLLEHKPTTLKPFQEVQAEIRRRLIDEESRKLALAEGREKLEKLRKGEDAGISWGKPVVVGRNAPGTLGEAAFKEAFRADASKLPAYVGAEDPKLGYQLIRVSAVNEPSEIGADARTAVAEQLRRIVSQEQLTDYVAALKRRIEVKMQPDLIEKKDR
jgi:peptidyl-prolyl cis-trans isomerase D